MTTSKALLLQVHDTFVALADPTRAAKMQAYMKSAMPYLGVTAVPLRRACKELFATHSVTAPKKWSEDVLCLWDHASYREERYAAIALSGDKRALEWHIPEQLELYEHMIVTGAWWDFVDEIAIHRVGAILLRRHPKELKKAMRMWSKSTDMWLRRASIICQVSFKKETDLKLLYECIERSMDSKEFFLRKAIGWALRSYAWVDPEEVKRYVRVNDKLLSGLSKREALKNL